MENTVGTGKKGRKYDRWKRREKRGRREGIKMIYSHVTSVLLQVLSPGALRRSEGVVRVPTIHKKKEKKI